MCFMQIESVLQTKNRSEPAKNRFSVALLPTVHVCTKFQSSRPHHAHTSREKCDEKF